MLSRSLREEQTEGEVGCITGDVGAMVGIAGGNHRETLRKGCIANNAEERCWCGVSDRSCQLS